MNFFLGLSFVAHKEYNLFCVLSANRRDRDNFQLFFQLYSKPCRYRKIAVNASKMKIYENTPSVSRNLRADRQKVRCVKIYIIFFGTVQASKIITMRKAKIKTMKSTRLKKKSGLCVLWCVLAAHVSLVSYV